MDNNLLIAVLLLLCTMFGSFVVVIGMNKIISYKLTLIGNKREILDNVLVRIDLIEYRMSRMDNYTNDSGG